MHLISRSTHYSCCCKVAKLNSNSFATKLSYVRLASITGVDSVWCRSRIIEKGRQIWSACRTQPARVWDEELTGFGSKRISVFHLSD